jgi:hypothetical protein
MCYLRDLEMKGVKATQRFKDEHKEEEWSFDLASRCWSHKLNGQSVFVDRAEGITKAVLLEKLLIQHAKNKLPQPKIIEAHLGELVGAKNAM